MNDGQYTNLRNYLEEIASQNRQLLEAVHEIRLAANRIDGRMKERVNWNSRVQEDAPTASTEKQLEAETGKDFARTGDNPPTFVKTDKRGTVATIEDTPVVPRRQDAPVEGLAGFAQPPAQAPKKEK